MTSADEPIFHGVRLEQHAGVTAALADDIPLADVLAQEGVAAASWNDANRNWRAAIVDAPDLQTRYLQKRRQAEDCLARRLPPLDEDEASWAGLLAAVSAADDALEVLAPLGLRVTDLARLGRHWTKKAAADPEVARKLADHAGKAPAPRAVRAEPVRLKPFPWTAAGRKSPASARAGSDGDELATMQGGVLPAEDDVDLYAALMVVLQLLPGDKRAVLELCGLDQQRLPAFTQRWRTRLDANPDLNADFAVRSADHRAAFRRILAGAKATMAPQPE